jgi:multidrug efflux pump subunit AcrA (membrane-fusion protein)
VSDRVADYATIIELTDPAALELQMNVNREQFDVTSEGQEVQIRTVEGAWVPARVIQTTHRNPARDASVRWEEYIVHLTVPRGAGEITLGKVFAAQIMLEKRLQTLVIPLTGLREYQGRTYVRVLEGELRREVDVKVGIRTDTQAEILDGLTEGQLVIGR